MCIYESVSYQHPHSYPTPIRSCMPQRWPSPTSRTLILFPGLSFWRNRNYSSADKTSDVSQTWAWIPALSCTHCVTQTIFLSSQLQSAHLEDGQNSHQWSHFHCYIYSAHSNFPVNVSHLPFPFSSWWRCSQRERTSGLCSCTTGVDSLLGDQSHFDVESIFMAPLLSTQV